MYILVCFFDSRQHYLLTSIPVMLPLSVCPFVNIMHGLDKRAKANNV